MRDVRNDRESRDDDDDDGYGPEDDNHRGGGRIGRVGRGFSRSRSGGRSVHDLVSHLTQEEPMEHDNEVEPILSDGPMEEDQGEEEEVQEENLEDGHAEEEEEEEDDGAVDATIPQHNEYHEIPETVRWRTGEKLVGKMSDYENGKPRDGRKTTASKDKENALETRKPKDDRDDRSFVPKGVAAPKSSDEPNENHENPEHGVVRSDYENQEHDHDHEGSGKDGVILMMSSHGSCPDHGSQRPHADRLQDLARRLSDLRDRIHGPVSCGSSGRRSTTPRMAMWWNSSSRATQVQPVCDVGSMQEMRVEAVLQGEEREGWPRRTPNPGCTTGSCCCSPARAAGHVPSIGDEFADLPGKGDGVEGTATSGDTWTSQCQDGCEGKRSSGKADAGGNHGISDYNDGKDTIPDEDSGTNNTDGKVYHQEPFTNSIIRTGPQDQGSPQATSTKCSNDSNEDNGHICNLGGDRDSGLGDRDCELPKQQPWSSGTGTMSGLWASLRSLRERMSGDGSGLAPQTSHQSQTSKSFQHDNLNTTSTTLPRDTTKDIMSVKNCCTKDVLPPLAWKLAKAATLTAVLMQPVKDVLSSFNEQLDLMEVACSPTSTLTGCFESQGCKCLRVNRMTGYDLDTHAGTTKLGEKIKQCPPRFTWVSLPCTRLSSLQNLTPRDEEQMAKFLKKRGQDLRRADDVAQGLEPVFEDPNSDMAWEWPKSAVQGWRSSAIRRLERLAKRHNRTIHKITIDGCAYGLKYLGIHIRKGWQILTTSRTLWLMLNKRCPQNHEHRECRGIAAQASSYYPLKMCQEIYRAMHTQWISQEKHIDFLTEKHLLGIDEKNLLDYHETDPMESVMALSRTKMNLDEAPTGKKLEAVKQMMLRVHRASGHAGFSNLQKLLEARGSPKWAIELAGTLQCPECQEAARPRLVPPASTGEEPQLFEIVGVDALRKNFCIFPF